jgi:hypothetical protein
MFTALDIIRGFLQGGFLKKTIGMPPIVILRA